MPSPQNIGTEIPLGQQLADAERCLAKGWTYLNANLDLFAPADPFEAEDWQRVCELALLFSCSVSWSGGSVRDALKPTEQFLLTFLADPAVAQYARKRLVLFNPFFVPYLALRPLGYRFEAYEEGLRAAHRAGYPRAIELTPYRKMEIQHLIWKAGLTSQRPQRNGAYKETILAGCRNPIHLNIPAVYSVTHTLFYLNDYCGSPELLPSEKSQPTIEIVESLFVHYWRKQNWDIVGELAINLVSLDRWDSILFRHGVGALLKAWERQADGALPGPNFNPEQAESEPDYQFKHCYHTTLVGILFCEAYRHRANAG